MLKVAQFKKDFSPKGEPLTIRVEASLGLKRNRFTISQADMTTRVFTPIMKDIICLIKEQIGLVADDIAAVILVGGFGQSSYLRSEIKAALSRDTPVLQPDDGWIAVVKGAAIHGLGYYHPSLSQVQIVSRIARRSYGSCLLAAYDMLRHDPKEA
jgi:serine/threonine-protein kinase ATR